MAIEYERVNWDTTKYVNPTNMNQMDAGIKAACDGVDENSSAITAINSTLPKTLTLGNGIINNTDGYVFWSNRAYGIDYTKIKNASASITVNGNAVPCLGCSHDNDNTFVFFTKGSSYTSEGLIARITFFYE